jgi:hypothetical protein
MRLSMQSSQRPLFALMPCIVKTSWFSAVNADYSKPRMTQGFNNPGIDYQLIPTKNKPVAVHYLDLLQIRGGSK